MFNINLSNQNKLVFIGLLISTILIFAIAVFSVMNIQNRLEDGFFEFRRISSKTLAIESAQMMEKMPDESILEN